MKDEKLSKKMVAHYAKNAAKGRHARFTLTMDLREIPPDQLAKHKMSAIQIKIGGGTLTASQAKRIMDVVNEDN